MGSSRTLVPLVYLLGLAVGSVVLADGSWKTVTGYRSGYALERQFEAGPALASEVVIVVLDGLRTDRAADLPTMQSLAASGASGTVRVPSPSLSNPARAALLTGAWPEVSGVTNNSSFERSPVQSLFGLAHERGLQTAAVGTGFWPKAFGDSIGYRSFASKPMSYEVSDLAGWQAETCAAVRTYFQATPAQLRVAGLLSGDEAGHTYGGASEEYIAVTAAADECLGQLVENSGPDATFVAVSDHGHIDRWGKGGHGGQEPEVLGAPFAMTGPGIRQAGSIAAEIVDIAPTVSVLLGLPIPANSQGRVLWEALDVPEEEEARLRDLERVQREALAAHLPDKAGSLQAQRESRLPAAIAACAWFAFVGGFAVWRQRPAPLAAAVAIFTAVYYALFYAFQLGYSLSHIVRQEFLHFFFARNILAAVLGVSAAGFALAQFAGRGSEPLLRFAALVTSVLALLVAATYYQHGLRMDGWMLEIGPGFKAYLDMLAICGVVLGTILVLAYRALFGRRQGGPA